MIQQPSYEVWVDLTLEIAIQQLEAVIPALVPQEATQSDHCFIPDAA